MIISRYPMNTNIKVLDRFIGSQSLLITKWVTQIRNRPNSLHQIKPCNAKSLSLGRKEKCKEASRYDSAANKIKIYVSTARYLNCLLDIKSLIKFITATLSKNQNIERTKSNMKPSFHKFLGLFLFQYSQNLLEHMRQ